MAAETARILRELPKGDALATAQVAGIMAAKRTSELIPLCHPLPLSHVEVTLEVGEESVEIVASAETTAQTGVEMEALTAASVAALTVYDMAKAVDKGMRIVEVVARREDEGAGRLKAAVLTVSDGVVAGTREDRSGDALEELLRRRRVTRSSGASFPTSATDRGGDPRARGRGPSRADDRRHGARAARRHARGDARRPRPRGAGDRAGAAGGLDSEDAARPAVAWRGRRRRLDARRQPPRLARRLPRRVRGAAALRSRTRSSSSPTTRPPTSRRDRRVRPGAACRRASRGS